MHSETQAYINQAKAEGHTVYGFDMHPNVEIKKKFGEPEVLHDLDKPGTFFDTRWNPVPEAVARRAGFAVDDLRALARAKSDQVEIEARIRGMVEQASKREALRKSGDYAMFAAGDADGMALFVIERADGGAVTSTPVTEEVAWELWKAFTGEDEDELKQVDQRHDRAQDQDHRSAARWQVHGERADRRGPAGLPRREARQAHTLQADHATGR